MVTRNTATRYGKGRDDSSWSILRKRERQKERKKEENGENCLRIT
jgi:hypothetical protein